MSNDYQSLTNVFSTLESLNHCLECSVCSIFGSCCGMHPAFTNAILVEQVVYELGADCNSGSARLVTADGPGPGTDE